MYAAHHLHHAAAIIEMYTGGQPFALWLKNYFRQQKKFGARDRKRVAHLCYCYFRLGRSFAAVPVKEKIITGVFLCSEGPSDLLQELKPEWNEKANLPLRDKIKLLPDPDMASPIFPWLQELSAEMERETFALSFLQQPKVFLRIRPGKEKNVKASLVNQQVAFEEITADGIAVENSVAVDRLLKLDEEAVVQDMNSQRVLDLVKQDAFTEVWDCCAASGGKTILFHDRFPYKRLTVSDIRVNILHNLQARLQRAGIRNYDHFVADVADPQFRLDKKFDFIICDAPCSGSGTWGRSPEQLSFFKADKIDYYATLQKKIVTNAAKCLNDQGSLIYITCSVFTKENEEVVRFINDKLSLNLQASHYFKGYDKRADTLFAALFRKK